MKFDAGRLRVVVAAPEVINLALRDLLTDTVGFLQQPAHLLRIAIDLRNVAIGQIAPCLLDTAFELRPLSLSDVLIHPGPLSGLIPGIHNSSYE